MRHAMMIELDKCIGCQACVTSCKERWDSGPNAARDWVMTFSHGSREEGDLGVTFYPGMCNQCDEHPCTEDCPTGATYANENGVVVVDPDVCIGCGNCVPKCPYGARFADSRKGIVEKCNLCAPYVARGEEPACVATCLADCRHFGDLDDPDGELNRRIRDRKAKPLTTNEIDVGPRLYYAPPAERMQVLAQGVVRRYGSTTFTELYQKVTKPAARWAVAPIIVATGLAGVAVNLRMRVTEAKGRRPATHDELRADSEAPARDGARARDERQGDPGDHRSAAQGAQARPLDRASLPATLPRHAAGMRFLHWFNLLSWIVLLSTGTALMATVGFALFGESFPEWLAGLVGGRARLLYLHALWGVAWSVITIPLFLYFKRGGIEALRELRPTYDDVRWMVVKPLVMLGLAGKERLPPQDKYNAGQKAFALSAMAGTALIVLTGFVMTFHLGSAEVVRAAILVHKLAIMLALVGIAVHVTMAAIIVEERPSLWSMIVGVVDAHHASEHSSKWVAELVEAGNGAEPSSEPRAEADEASSRADADEPEKPGEPDDSVDSDDREESAEQGRREAEEVVSRHAPQGEQA